MNKKDDRSKQLAYLLRHDQDAWRLGKIDPNGWRNTIELQEDYGYTQDELQEIVNTDTKGRYELSENKLHIRALQGHSIPVEVDSIVEMIPPEILYHGTPEKNKESILKKGLLKGSRLYVHLSADYDTALNVGKRRNGPTIVFKVKTAEMSRAGIKFWKSANNVWLCSYVDPKYLELYVDY